LDGVPRLSITEIDEDPTNFSGLVSKAANSSKEKIVIADIPFRTYVLATHPDTARDLLKNDKQISKAPLKSSIIGGLAGNSIVFANGEEWRHQRQVLAPAFQFDNLKVLLPVILQKTNEALDLVPNNITFDVAPWINHFSLDSLGLASFGVDFRTLSVDCDFNEYYYAYKDLILYLRKALRGRIPPYIVEWFPLPSVLKARKARDILLRMTQEIADRRKKGVALGEQKYLIDMMLEAHLPYKDIQMNTFIFFLAGHESTAASLIWALSFLAEHKDIQTRLREEIDTVLQGKQIEAENFKDLTYLDMVIKEVLRYTSPISQTSSRKTDEDVKIGDYLIPKDTVIGLGIYAIHHNPEFWPNPERFDPERFNPQNTEKRHPYSYIPFAHGKRSCIGNNFSLIEQKVFLTTLMQRYTIDLSAVREPIKLAPQALARAPVSMPLVLSARRDV